eukprot:3272048-Prymnesium_polylepis.1
MKLEGSAFHLLEISRTPTSTRESIPPGLANAFQCAPTLPRRLQGCARQPSRKACLPHCLRRTMPFCDNCGTKYEEGAKFCMNCGKNFEGVHLVQHAATPVAQP